MKNWFRGRVLLHMGHTMFLGILIKDLLRFFEWVSLNRTLCLMSFLFFFSYNFSTPNWDHVSISFAFMNHPNTKASLHSNLFVKGDVTTTANNLFFWIFHCCYGLAYHHSITFITSIHQFSSSSLIDRQC